MIREGEGGEREQRGKVRERRKEQGKEKWRGGGGNVEAAAREDGGEGRGTEEVGDLGKRE